jgi:TolA-binding protein
MGKGNNMNPGTTITFIFATTLALFLFLSGCGKREEKPTINTRETENTKGQVEQSKSDMSEGQKAEVEKAFADLEKEIRELEIRVEKTEGEARAEAKYKLDALKIRRDELRKEFNKAKFDALMDDVKSALTPGK